MSNMAVATARRGIEMDALRNKLVQLDKERSFWQFTQDGYAAKRRADIEADRERVLSEIAALEALTDEQLVERFNPPPIDSAGGLSIKDGALARGEYMASQVVVHRDPLPGYRVGGDPYPAVR